MVVATVCTADGSEERRGHTATIRVKPLRQDKPSLKPVVNDGIDVTIGGFIKLDGIYSEFDRGDALSANGRDFFVPSSIPVGDTNNTQRSLDMHAKETRLFIKTDITLGDDIKIGSYVEFDFLVNPGAGTAAVTNAYNPGLRRAYFTYGNWLIGQDWTTFQNTGALPEGLDFIGPTDGSVFGRQPLVRYSLAGWQFALENPETSLLGNGGATRVLTDDNVMPDLIVRRDFKSDFGFLSVAALGRELRSKLTGPAGLTSDDKVFAGGLSFMGKINLGRDDLRFSAAGGKGVGRYIGINTVTDAVVASGGKLEAIPVVGGYLAYRHAWNDKWRSTVTVSALSADNNSALTGNGVTRRVDSYHLNLLYSPVAKVTFGVEGMSARRETEAQFGYMRRVQVSAKYAF